VREDIKGVEQSNGVNLRRLANGSYAWSVYVRADASTYHCLIEAVKTAQEVDLYLRHEYPAAEEPEPEQKTDYRPGQAARTGASLDASGSATHSPHGAISRENGLGRREKNDLRSHRDTAWHHQMPEGNLERP
jgi:hypothetical protein